MESHPFGLTLMYLLSILQAQGLDKENVVVKGRNGQKPGEFPYLIMSWHGQNSDYTNFQCVAHGIDSKGKLTSLSSDVKRKPDSVRCSHSKDSVYCELQKMSSKLEAIANTNEKLSVQVKALNAKYALLKAIADTGEKLSVQMKGLDAKYGLLEAIADTGEKLSVHVKGLDAKYGLLEAIANAGQKLSVHVKGLDAKYGLLEAIVNAGQKLFVEVEGLDAKYGLLSEGFKELKGKSDSLRDQLSVKNRLAAINRDKFYVSRTHNNRVYLVRKAVESFNLARANRLCGESGGYLVEFDDTEELQLVLGIVSKVGGTDSFFTGGNDVDWEGHFVYYNSKKPVPNLRWRRGQPDNGRGSEDCMQIKVSWGALNDDQCYERGKYVCEVPLRDL